MCCIMIVGIDAVLSFYKFIENQQKIVFLKIIYFPLLFYGYSLEKKIRFFGIKFMFDLF